MMEDSYTQIDAMFSNFEYLLRGIHYGIKIGDAGLSGRTAKILVYHYNRLCSEFKPEEITEIQLLRRLRGE